MPAVPKCGTQNNWEEGGAARGKGSETPFQLGFPSVIYRSAIILPNEYNNLNIALRNNLITTRPCLGDVPGRS